jgi:epoxide hydrolase-like predicted phosphatase
MIKAIIFDFFGVLTKDYTRELEEAATPEVATAIWKLTRQNDLGEVSDGNFVIKLSALTGVPQVTINNEFYGHPTLNSGLLKLISNLKLHYKTGLISNASATSLTPYWTRSEMNEYFDESILSGEVGLVKPEHKIYQLACDRLGILPAEAVFIDDSEHNVTAAEDIGMVGVHFKSVTDLKAQLARVLNRSII